MKIMVKKAVNIPDGVHEGTIINIIYREKPYEYADLYIEFEGLQIKVGFARNSLTENSMLGQLLIRFGARLVEGKEVDPDKVLIGKKCSFITITEQTKKGKFAKVRLDSVRPVDLTQGQLQ